MSLGTAQHYFTPARGQQRRSLDTLSSAAGLTTLYAVREKLEAVRKQSCAW